MYYLMLSLVLGLFLVLPSTVLAAELEGPQRDEFFWLGQINKASLLVNSQEKLLTQGQSEKFAQGLAQILQAGGEAGAVRPKTVIGFEPLLIEAAGAEITMLHAGRSSQDMHATFNAMMLREDILGLAKALNSAQQTLLTLAENHQATVVPSYTNGVAAQPTSYSHYLLAYSAGFARDMERLQQYYARLNRSPMGTTVLNGTSWPLNRDKMAAYLGFDSLAYNAYDAGQIFSLENPAEIAHLATSISLHIGSFIEDVMQQYAQPRPWILLQEGGENTYVSSAMPQKRNPGLLNSTRRDASTLLGYAVGGIMRAHNLPPGMADARGSELNQTVQSTAQTVKRFEQILLALQINPERALEELNLDWTASQELADILMREYKIPFRVGHHFASEIVGYARTNALTPLSFPYSEASRIYTETVANYPELAQEFPLTEAQFKSALDPVAIINNRATKGGPQPAELAYMLKEAQKMLAQNKEWVKTASGKLTAAENKLNCDFAALLK